MVNAPQHELAKWLTTLLQPVVHKYSDHAIKDTFEFCANLEACAVEMDVRRSYMCSFDVASFSQAFRSKKHFRFAWIHFTEMSRF